MNKTLTAMVGYLYQVLQILAVAIGIMTLVLASVAIWKTFGLV